MTLTEETIEALERIGCQFNFCNGPTLEPESMVTCFVCDLLARLRVSIGLPPRRDDEQTAQERWNTWNAEYMALHTRGRIPQS